MTEWDADGLRTLNEVEEIRITPRRADGSPHSGVLVWVLEVEGRVYVRSWKGAEAAWYRHIREALRATVAGGPLVAEATAHPVDDPGIQAKVDAEYLAKYGRYADYADAMNEPLAAATTLELRPV